MWGGSACKPAKNMEPYAAGLGESVMACMGMSTRAKKCNHLVMTDVSDS